MSESIREMFKKCAGSLRAMRPSLVAKQDAALAEAVVAGELLEQLDAAIDRLEGNPVKRRVGRKKESAAPKESNCSTKEEILELIVDVLDSSGPASVEELKDEVAKRLRERGRSLSGFSRIFSICLTDEALNENPPGTYSLAERTAPGSSTRTAETLN